MKKHKQLKRKVKLAKKRKRFYKVDIARYAELEKEYSKNLCL